MRRLSKVAVALASVLAVGPAAAWAADEEPSSAGSATVRKTKEQLHFELPPDWPIEKRGGVVGPIPVEEYLAMKFKGLEARLQAVQQQMSGMDLRVRVLEDNSKSKSAAPGLRSSGNSQP